MNFFFTFFFHFLHLFDYMSFTCTIFWKSYTSVTHIVYPAPPFFFRPFVVDVIGSIERKLSISLTLWEDTIKRKRRRLRMSNKYVYLFISQTSCQDDSVLSLGNLVTETKISILRRRVIYFNPLTLRISLVILLTVCHTIHMMLV